MAQAGPVVWGRFDETDPPVQGAARLRLHRGVLRNRPAQRLRSRLRLADVAPLPIAMAHLMAEETGMFGEELLERMQDYNHYAAIGVLGEILPDARNYVSIHPTEKDQFGIPLPYAHFNLSRTTGG